MHVRFCPATGAAWTLSGEPLPGPGTEGRRNRSGCISTLFAGQPIRRPAADAGFCSSYRRTRGPVLAVLVRHGPAATERVGRMGGGCRHVLGVVAASIAAWSRQVVSAGVSSVSGVGTRPRKDAGLPGGRMVRATRNISDRCPRFDGGFVVEGMRSYSVEGVVIRNASRLPVTIHA